MRILLVNQKGYEREECCVGKIHDKVLPSQLLLCAAYLESRGHRVDVADEQFMKPDLSSCDVVVAIVAAIEGFYDDIKVLEKAKKEGKKTVAILNDPYGLEMDMMQKYSFIDFCVRWYEREYALERLASELKKEKPDFRIPGLIYRENKPVDNGLQQFMTDLEHLPSCSAIMKRLPLEKYDRAWITNGRGCPMMCTFCQYRGSGARKRKVSDVIDEMLTVSQAGIRTINLTDENLAADKKWLDDFLDELIKNKGKISPWVSQFRAENATESIVKKLKEAGCSTILIGVESVDDEVLEKVNKKINVKKIIAAIKMLMKHGINADTSIIIGFPWDSDKTLDSLYRFIKKVPTSSIGIVFLMPIKGTPLYEQMKELKLLERELTIDDYVYARLSEPICPTLYLSKEELKKWFRKLQSVRFRPAYLVKHVMQRGIRKRDMIGLVNRIKEQFSRS